MRVLLTGASGLFGANALLQYADRFDLIAAVHRHQIIGTLGPASLALDITQPAAVLEAFRRARPDVVLHAAAMTNVDACEERPAQAEQLNVRGAESVARAAHAVGAWLIALSTDYVFDGARGRYTEEDRPNPLGVYARTKWLGEQAVAAHCPRATVVRTTLYGWNAQPKQSFAERALEGVSGGQSGGGVTAFTDMFWSPILANDLADALVALIKQPTPGIFHVAGRERVSRYEFARAVAVTFGQDPDAVRPGRLAEAQLKAPRPADGSLAVAKFERTFGATLPTTRQGLDRMRALADAGWPQRLKQLVGHVMPQF